MTAALGVCGIVALVATSSPKPRAPGFVDLSSAPALRGAALARSDAELRSERRSELRGASESRLLVPMLVPGFLLTTVLTLQRRQSRPGPSPRVRSSSKVCRLASIMEAEEVEVEDVEEDSAMVKKTSVLLLGGTGTLGRQVVRQFLKAGYNVRCLVRNRADRPFAFLADWGATLVEGSLLRPESLPGVLVGIHTVIDCATARPDESIYEVDWEGKKRFIQYCEKMAIQRYIFVSMQDCDKFRNVPLMDIKYMTEKFLAKTKLRYTILRSTGFMQPLISQYAVSILDKKPVWTDDGNAPGMAYMDSQDCARMVAAATMLDRTVGQTLNISGPKVWNAGQVIQLCEQLSGRKAEVNVASTALVQSAQRVASFFQWSHDIAERLAFIQGQSSSISVMSDDAYRTLGIDARKTRTLEEYMGEYYRRIFKKLTKTQESEAEVAQTESFDRLDASQAAEPIELDLEDKLPPGQLEGRDISVMDQRRIAALLTDVLSENLSQMGESEDYRSWFGWTKGAEKLNGQSAMLGFSLGLFTEYETGVSVSDQVDQLIGLFGHY